MIGHPEAAGMQERAHDGEAGAEDGDGGFEVEPDGWWQVDPGDVHGLGELDEDDEADDVEGAGAVGCVSYTGRKWIGGGWRGQRRDLHETQAQDTADLEQLCLG